MKRWELRARVCISTDWERHEILDWVRYAHYYPADVDRTCIAVRFGSHEYNTYVFSIGGDSEEAT